MAKLSGKAKAKARKAKAKFENNKQSKVNMDLLSKMWGINETPNSNNFIADFGMFVADNNVVTDITISVADIYEYLTQLNFDIEQDGNMISTTVEHDGVKFCASFKFCKDTFAQLVKEIRGGAIDVKLHLGDVLSEQVGFSGERYRGIKVNAVSHYSSGMPCSEENQRGMMQTLMGGMMGMHTFFNGEFADKIEKRLLKAA